MKLAHTPLRRHGSRLSYASHRSCSTEPEADRYFIAVGPDGGSVPFVFLN
jgi:hypothetical protein